LLALLVTAVFLVVSSAGAADPATADLQRWLKDAKTTKAAADAKVAEANEQNLEIKAKRDKINAELKDLKTRSASADQTINSSQTEINKGAGEHAKDLQESIAYQKSNERKIQEKMPGVSLKDGNQVATILDNLNNPNFKNFSSRQVNDVKKEIRDNELKQKEALDKAGASGTSREESIRLTDEEYPKLQKEKAELEKKLDDTIEQERRDIRWRMDELKRTGDDIKKLDPDGKLEAAAQRLIEAQREKEDLLDRTTAAEESKLKLDNSKERQAAVAQAAAAAAEVSDLEKRVAQAQATEAAAAKAKTQPQPTVVAKTKKPAANPSPTPQTVSNDTSTSAPAPTSPPDQVTVPDLSAFENVSEMKAVLAHAGLVGSFSASAKTPSKELEFKFAGQSPAANSKVAPGSTVTVTIYQKFEDVTTAATSTDDVIVPDLSVFDNVSEMKAVLAHAGLIGAFNSTGTPPSKEKEFKFASQRPAANTKVKNGSTVTISIFGAFDSGTEAGDKVPNLNGLTLEAATAKLSAADLSVAGIENSAKTDNQEKVNTIYEQSPAAGANIPDNKAVRVKIYGSLISKGPAPTPNPLDSIISSSDKGLIGSFSGTAQMTTYEFYDTKHERPIAKSPAVTISIGRDAQGTWHFGGRITPNIGLGEVGASGESTTVSGGTLTFEQHTKSVDRVCTVKVAGNQLTGTCQNTLKDGSLQPAPINFTATRN
jgi:beta-lactam-binding protein with PASTA domain